MTVPDERAGASFQCPRCGREGTIPKPPTPAPKAPPAARGHASRAAHPSAPPRSDEPPDEIDEIRFGGKREEDEGMDMTPMVDVVFLLLIFFMVTAAYSLQKSIEVPAPDQEEASTQARPLEEYEQDDDYVIIRIARDNSIWVNEQEAPSEQELLVKLRESREAPASGSRGPSSLLILADSEALHETVVMALDAGNAVGMENVRLACVDEEDL